MILPTYVDLEARADGAATPRSLTLGASVTRSTWTTARDGLASHTAALGAVRRPFSSVRWRPQGIDPGIDSWPVNVADLDAVLASGSTLTQELSSTGSSGTLKGFHTIEYLLFGAGGGKTAARPHRA